MTATSFILVFICGGSFLFYSNIGPLILVTPEQSCHAVDILTCSYRCFYTFNEEQNVGTDTMTMSMAVHDTIIGLNAVYGWPNLIVYAWLAPVCFEMMQP